MRRVERPWTLEQALRRVASGEEVCLDPAGGPFEGVSLETHILDDLKVNSARLVDVVLEFEDAFDIEITDDDVDSVETVGDAVRLIEAKAA